MIESSIIKLILIVALNICFVWVWVKKESLRKKNLSKIKKKLEEISFFKKYEKIITFIENINMFWILNTSYFLLIKFFEEILNMTLGFPYGVKYIEKSIETPFFKVDYFCIKTLEEITKFLFDSGNFITLFIGLTGMLVAIYIYAISIDNKLKKYILLHLIGKESLFYLSFYIVVLFLFRSESIFLIGPIGYLIYLLTDSIKWILKINSESSYEENFKKLRENVFMGKFKDIKDLYIEVKKSLYSAVKNEELMEIEENKYYFNVLLENYAIELKEIVKDNSGDSIIKFLYDLYDEVYRNKNDNIFQKISFLHIEIAKYYQKNNDKENFYWALCGMEKVYDYYNKNKIEKLEWDVISGFKGDSFWIWETYKENFDEGMMWYAQIFKAVMKGIKKAVKNNDFYFFQQFIYLIGEEFKYRDEIERDYKLLERSVYFGVLLYLKEEKRKRENDRTQYKKTDEFLEFIEKIILSNNELVDLIELYEFINEQIRSDRSFLNWEDYFNPKMELVKITLWDNRLGIEKNKLFLELLGKINYSEYDEEALDDKIRLKDCLEIGIDFGEGVKIDFEKSSKRIDHFKKEARSLLNDLEKSKDKIEMTEEGYQRIKELLKGLAGKYKQKEKEELREVEISQSKINDMKRILETVLKESKIIKLFKGINKYKLSTEKSEEKSLGINKYYQKKTFTDLDGSNLIELLAKQLGETQNNGINKIIIRLLDKIAENQEGIIQALENVSGDPWIILSGVNMFDFFRKEKNIIRKSNLEKNYFEKYGEILEGIYIYNGKKVPIYNLNSNRNGIYILDSNDIESFIHYNIEEDVDKRIEYASLEITDTKKLIEVKGEEEILKNKWPQECKTNEEKLNYFKELILIEFNQKGELKLKEDAKVYKVEFNG